VLQQQQNKMMQADQPARGRQLSWQGLLHSKHSLALQDCRHCYHLEVGQVPALRAYGTRTLHH
jgi:hypothetical protein